MKGSKACVTGVPVHAATAQEYSVSVQAPPPSTKLTCPFITKLDKCLIAPLLTMSLLTLTAFHLIFWPVIILAPLDKHALNSVSVSSFNISDSHITASWEVGFFTSRPNFIGSGLVLFSVFYKNQLLSEASVPKFYISTNFSFTVNVFASAKRIDDPRIADAIARDWSESGVVAFTFRLLDTSKNYNSIKHYKVIYGLNVTCPDIKVGFSDQSSSHGTLFLQHSPNITTRRQAFGLCSSEMPKK